MLTPFHAKTLARRDAWTDTQTEQARKTLIDQADEIERLRLELRKMRRAISTEVLDNVPVLQRIERLCRQARMTQ